MQLRRYPLICELESSLAAIVPSEPVTVAGAWSSSRRRAYQRQAQIGFGCGPFLEIVDTRWAGTVACPVPIACITFLLTPGSLFWARSTPALLGLPVELSVHAYAGYTSDRATFASAVDGARLPSVPMRFSGDARRDVALEITGHVTGQLARLARLEDAEVFIYMIPGSLLKVRRKRIWHLRDEFAATLPSAVRGLLTRGRNGRIRAVL